MQLQNLEYLVAQITSDNVWSHYTVASNLIGSKINARVIHYGWRFADSRVRSDVGRQYRSVVSVRGYCTVLLRIFYETNLFIFLYATVFSSYNLAAANSSHRFPFPISSVHLVDLSPRGRRPPILSADRIEPAD